MNHLSYFMRSALTT